MANVAEFETAPTGTQYRTGPNDDWANAEVGNKLGEGYESRNTQANDYQVRLYSDACIEFDQETTVTLGHLEGGVIYKDFEGNWIPVPGAGQYSSTAFGTKVGGGVSVICGARGVYPPRPWN